MFALLPFWEMVEKPGARSNNYVSKSTSLGIGNPPFASQIRFYHNNSNGDLPVTGSVVEVYVTSFCYRPGASSIFCTDENHIRVIQNQADASDNMDDPPQPVFHFVGQVIGSKDESESFRIQSASYDIDMSPTPSRGPG